MIGDIIGRRRAFIVGLVIWIGGVAGAGIAAGPILGGLSLAFTRDLPSGSPRAQGSEAEPALSSEP